MKRLMLLSSALFLLTRCVGSSDKQQAKKLPSGWHAYENTNYHYEIGIPDTAFIEDKNQTKDQIFFGNISPFSNNSNAFDIDLYAGNKVTSCSKMGVSKPAESITEGIDVQKGRVDFYDQFKGGENPDPQKEPLCRPPGSGSAYALCSQHKGKTVLVCVSQVTDDPALAEEIFKTFRWTD